MLKPNSRGPLSRIYKCRYPVLRERLKTTYWLHFQGLAYRAFVNDLLLCPENFKEK